MGLLTGFLEDLLGDVWMMLGGVLEGFWYSFGGISGGCLEDV